ncbi:MAG: CBS domain-containing protein [Polyangiaceae bacterium]
MSPPTPTVDTPTLLRASHGPDVRTWAMPVHDYASETLFAVGPETSLDDLENLLEDRGFSSVAVVDGNGALLGIVSTTDLLRDERKDLDGRPEGSHARAAVRRVAEVMRREVVCVDAFAPLSEAAALLVHHGIHRVIVTRAGKGVGVLSARDLLRAVQDARVPTPLADVMVRPVATVEVGDSIRFAIERLDDANVRGLVVVDGEWPVGVFTHAEALAAKRMPRPLLESPVERVMSYETICLDAATPLYRAAGYAIQLRTRRILVVEGRELRGIVTGFDMARGMVAG